MEKYSIQTKLKLKSVNNVQEKKWKSWKQRWNQQVLENEQSIQVIQIIQNFIIALLFDIYYVISN